MMALKFSLHVEARFLRSRDERCLQMDPSVSGRERKLLRCRMLGLPWKIICVCGLLSEH